jgi:transitional endoplasmic reticulum ATPase
VDKQLVMSKAWPAGHGWRVREFHESDTEQIVMLAESTRDLPDSAPLSLVGLVAALRSALPTVVAMSGPDLVAFAVAEVTDDHARLLGLRIHPNWRGRGLGSGLIHAMEERLLHAGVRRIEALLGTGQVGEEALVNRGFVATRGLTLFSKDIPLTPSEVSVLDEWGGELVDPAAWSQIAGMIELKDLIDDRLLRPLLAPELAEMYGLSMPAALVLFGPPGTGKTSFARAVAARLGWPFVELLPSKLAAGAGGLAAELRRALRELSQLEHVVAFIDEFDEIATSRTAEPEGRAVVNELLKAIPQFRNHPGRLLICATNFVERLDPAVIRPGRFDLVIPVGPPDRAAREAMWLNAANRNNAREIDVATLAANSEGFTPADVTLAAQRAAFAAFRQASEGEETTLTTDDYLRAIYGTPASIDIEAAAEFAQLSEQYART